MAKPKDRTPIWTRPAPGTRQPKLTREQIAEAALAIADSEGFAEVSMRRVAAELDVGTMTLYYYVKTKDDLIALMDDAISAAMVIPEDEIPHGWRAAITRLAAATRDVFLRHPWALYLLQGARIGPNGLRHIEQSLRIVEDAPFDTKGKLRLLSIVDDYVFGHVLRVSEADAHPMDYKVMKVIAEFMAHQLESGEYPRLSALMGGGNVMSMFEKFARWMTEDERFDLGLVALLDGLEAKMSKTNPARPDDKPSDHGAPPPVRRVERETATDAAVDVRRARKKMHAEVRRVRGEAPRKARRS